MRRVTAAVVVLLVAVSVWAWRSAQRKAMESRPTLTVAYPMGIQAPMLVAVAKFEEWRPGVTVELLGGTPEALARDIVQGAKTADVFVSPGGHEAMALVERGLLQPQSMVAFGSYQLALLAPMGNPEGLESVQDLLKPGVRTVSLSDREFSTVTHVARQAFERMGLWERLEPKVTFTDDCAQSYQALVNGRVDANVQFVECPMRPGTTERAQKERVAEVCRFPPGAAYVPRNVAGVMSATQQSELAHEFIRFLAAPDTQRLMVENGLRNDADLPLVPSPWGPEHEEPPTQ